MTCENTECIKSALLPYNIQAIKCWNQPTMKHYCNDSILMQEWQHKKPDSHHDIVDVMNILLLIHARTEPFQKDMKKDSNQDAPP
jgi:hypothetical protein